MDTRADDPPAATDAPGGTRFEREATRVMTTVRAAFDAVLGSAGLDVASGPTALARKLAIDTKLAWKVTNLLGEADEFAAAAYVPGRTAAELFLQAAGAAGASEAARARARASLVEFEELERVHAGDRRTLGLLLAGCTAKRQAKVELEQRKNAFHAGSYLWGLRARLQTQTFLFHANDGSERLDVAWLASTVDLLRMRPDASWRIFRREVTDDAGPVPSQSRGPIDPRAEGDPLPFVHEFCTSPLPRVRSLSRPGGRVHHILSVEDVGNQSAVTVTTGEVVRDAAARYRHPASAENAAVVYLRTPCERLVVDLLAPREIFGDAVPRAKLFSDLYQSGGAPDRLGEERLPIHEEIHHLGSGLRGLRLREWPRYVELVDHAVAGLGWRAEDLEAWRLELRYPPVPTSLLLAQDLPERPAPGADA